MNRLETVVLFLEKAALAAAGVRKVESAAEMAVAIAELVAADKTVYCPALSALERAAAALLVRRVAGYREAEVTVEEVLAGIAETGSIVCASVEGRAVQASLLPSQHLALLPAGKIYPTLDDFFQSLGATLPTNIAVITGPSRTADIELTLAIGVHGPKRLDVIVVAE
jgi:L-lactate dehydrogenase complex protein LldG